MATNKTYTVIKDGIELKELKTLAAAKKLADAEGAQVVCDGDTVYVGAQHITPTTTLAEETIEETVAEERVETYTLTAKMNVRMGPSKNAVKLGIAQPGTIVEVIEIVDDWLYLTDGTFILYEGGKFAKKN